MGTITRGHSRRLVINLIAPTLDAAFIEKQRRHLVELRAALLESMQNDEAEEAGIKRERLDRPQEYEDDTQKLTKLELGGNLVVRIRKRLAIVERALKKLEGGTYGVSDVSGRSIPLCAATLMLRTRIPCHIDLQWLRPERCRELFCATASLRG